MGEMTFDSSIRRIEGRVDINFFANGVDDQVSVSDTNSNPADIFRQYRNLFNFNLPQTRRFAALGDSFLFQPDKSEQYYLFGGEDTVGWWGDSYSTESGLFGAPQYIELSFQYPRQVSAVRIVGDVMRGEYPTDFKLTFYKKDTAANRYTEMSGVQTKVSPLDTAKCMYSVDISMSGAADKMRLDITAWNKPGQVAKLNYFSSEMFESFTGDKLKSIEILEEKTGDTDKLSYGISSNYCKVSLLNENKKFYDPDYYNLLRKNRIVVPTVRCGADQESFGNFYSEEWELTDDSMYFTCKAYDVLYSLQDMTINYGMERDVNGAMFSLYHDQTVEQIIDRVFELINQNRKDNGILGNELVKNVLLTPATKNTVIPYVMIEEKSAWDVLKDIATFCCAYIYVNRRGEIVIEEDDFTGKTQTPVAAIDSGNAFSYTLPVNSNIVVNQVKVEYYDFEVNDDGKDDSITVKKEDLIISDNYGQVELKLKKIYNVIKSITCLQVSELEVVKYNFDSIVLSFELTDDIPSELKFSIYASDTGVGYKSIKKEYVLTDEQSISENGVKEFSSKANLLFLGYIPKIKENQPYRYQDIADRIIKKYKKGLSFVETEWKGDCNLVLSDCFTGRSQFDSIKQAKEYECLSNEIKLDSKFRLKTKGRQKFKPI